MFYYLSAFCLGVVVAAVCFFFRAPAFCRMLAGVFFRQAALLYTGRAADEARFLAQFFCRL